jgi:hypothetical protein
MLPQVRVGEGYLCKATPHPFESLGRPLSPLPQGERAREATAACGRTNLRLYETAIGSVSLFPTCYLQGTLQPQRVEPCVRGLPTPRRA